VPPAAARIEIRPGTVRRVILVGLTGGIGAGKSSVSALLAAKGAVIVDADAVTRQVQQRGEPVLAAIADRFGPGILTADGQLDRAALAAIVFADVDELAALNAIVHPAVSAEMRRQLDALAGTDEVVVLDVALLVEGLGHGASVVVVVDTDPEIAVDRLVHHRGMTEADARARMARQATRVERLQRADYVVSNDGDPDELAAQVDELWPALATLAPTPWPPGPPGSSGSIR